MTGPCTHGMPTPAACTMTDPTSAATLAEARRLAPLIDDLTDVCPYCRYPGPGHGRDDDCPLCDLLDLLTEDGA